MNFLDSLQDLEKNPTKRKYTSEEYKLEEYRAWVLASVAAREGNPKVKEGWREISLKRPAVHIAGTKGKGSTSALVDSLLQASGLRSGLYTSPHQLHYGERFRLQNTPISQEQFEDLGNRLLARGVLQHAKHNPTVFELLTAMAIELFEGESLDSEVYEVGLGGRLDCTNIITPRVTVITSIGLDHTAILGDTHEKIAAEKAGILKGGIPAVIFREGDSERQNAARAGVLQRAAEVGAPLVELPFCEGLGISKPTDDTPLGQRVRINWKGHACDGLECCLALLGPHQVRNLELALAAAETFLQQQGQGLSREAVATALRTVYWPGRLQYLVSLPAVLVDSAHCPHSAHALGRSLAELREIAPPPYVLLWGMQRDKNHRAFLEAFLEAVGRENVSRIICYTLQGERGAPASMLFTAGRECLMKCMAQESLEEAFNSALTFARPGSVLALGSVYPTGRLVELHAQKVNASLKRS